MPKCNCCDCCELEANKYNTITRIHYNDKCEEKIKNRISSQTTSPRMTSLCFCKCGLVADRTNIKTNIKYNFSCEKKLEYLFSPQTTSFNSPPTTSFTSPQMTSFNSPLTTSFTSPQTIFKKFYNYTDEEITKYAVKKVEEKALKNPDNFYTFLGKYYNPKTCYVCKTPINEKMVYHGSKCLHSTCKLY